MRTRLAITLLTLITLTLTACSDKDKSTGDSGPELHDVVVGDEDACREFVRDLPPNAPAGAAYGAAECRGIGNQRIDELFVLVGEEEEDQAQEPTEPVQPDSTWDGAFGLHDTVQFSGGRHAGVSLGLSSFARGVNTDTYGPEEHYVRFEITVTNDGVTPLSLSQTSVVCRYGHTGTAGYEYSDRDEGLVGIPEDNELLPGRSITFPYGCELPEGESYLHLDIGLSYGAQKAIFVGDVT